MPPDQHLRSEQIAFQGRDSAHVVASPRSDEVLLARILAALGSSDLSRSMREIADSMETGTLSDSDDILLDLRAACLTLEKMRLDLIEALGIKPE